MTSENTHITVLRLFHIAKTIQFTYLGIPLHHKRISNKDQKVIEDRFVQQLSTWKSKLLHGGRLTLINSVLSNLSVYMLFFFEIPKEVLKKLNFLRLRFFSQGNGVMDTKENADSPNRVFFI